MPWKVNAGFEREAIVMPLALEGWIAAAETNRMDNGMNGRVERYLMGEYDIIVVGAGHAGCEAGLAAARMGKNTLVLSMNLESVAMLACNPSIGGTGKGHLVREIDALGGEMGINIDKTFIQSKMLNTAKGPAVHSLRAQADKAAYHMEMKKTLENQQNLTLKQGEVVDLLVESESESRDEAGCEAENLTASRICGVIMRTGAVYKAAAVILATGTFLGGRIFVGASSFRSGPNGLAASLELSESLKNCGFELRRFKTGTPARALASTLDYSKMKEEKGDEKIIPFSFMNEEKDLKREQISCWLTYTNEDTHGIVTDNADRSPLLSGYIESIGPRYCLSIEDKVTRFPERSRHQLFIEPEGMYTEEMYVQGLSSSMPEDVQLQFYKTVAGMENVVLSRYAYSIEYDCINPLNLKQNLEYMGVSGLFCAGQLNGTSGYEEAAAQGLMAGINAVLSIDGKEPFVLDRSEAYIGVLIDDLVTKGTTDPYRIMTSRAEYRLLLRQDNADERLTPKGYELGLASKERYDRYCRQAEVLDAEMIRLKRTIKKPIEVNDFLKKVGTRETSDAISLHDLLKRPEITYSNMLEIDPMRPNDIGADIATRIEVRIKYAGYIEKQKAQVAAFKRMEKKSLPADIDYNEIDGLRLEAKEKLSQIKPGSMGQASRIIGVSPADINVLLICLEKRRRMCSKKSVSRET